MDEKEEEREEFDMNCGGITPTSLGSVKIGVSFLAAVSSLESGFSCTANQC